jgi:hypothetical protein
MAKKTVSGTTDDPTIQFATLELDGEKFKLAYDFNAIALAESVAGCNLFDGLQSLRDLNARQLRGLFYAALLKAQPAMTIDRAGAMVKLHTINPITDAIGTAYRLSMPKPSGNPPEPTDAANATA